MSNSVYGTGIGIYKIINTINNKCYIGSAAHLKSRKSNHFRELRRNNHCNKKLQHSFNKYGEEYFKFILLENCEKEILINREQYYLDSLNPFFNIRKLANSNLGIRFSEESKLKMRASQKGKIVSEETKELIKQSAKSCAIIQLSADGDILFRWRSIREAARYLNCNHTLIMSALKNNHKCRKYYWKYE